MAFTEITRKRSKSSCKRYLLSNPDRRKKRWKASEPAQYSDRPLHRTDSRNGAPLAVRLCDLIEGWIIALQQMCVGDKWEIYIPAEMGYGKVSQPGIPGGSTLIFEIELLGIA